MRLIRGAPGSGMTSLVFREFREALRAGRRDMRIVVPTATLVRHYQHELARDGAVFPPGAVLSLSRFAHERAPECRLVPDGLMRAFVRDALRRLKPVEFAEVATTEGMAATILDTIALFENASVTPEKLAANRKLTPRGKAFEKIWRDVDRAVTAAGFHTRAQVFRAASANRSSIPVWLDGFINFSVIEREFVASLDKSCEVTLTLANLGSADDTRRFAMLLQARDRLLPGASRKPAVSTVAAPTPEREADEIARRILDLHEKGVQFREIGVALRDAAGYLPLLQGTFERFGIPARFYFGSSLRRHPAAVFLGGLIECVLTGWEFGAALKAFRANPAWGSSSQLDRFDFKVRESMPGSGGAALLQLAEEDFARRVGPCIALDTWLTQTARPKEWALRLEQMAERLYRPGQFGIAQDHKALTVLRSHAAALGSWVEAVSSVAPFWSNPDELISLETFWKAAREAVDGASVPVTDIRRDVVHVMSVYEARQWDVCALFVCGMTDREFPRRNPQNLLFPDSDLENLKLNVRKASDQDGEETALWDALKTRAQDHLILSYPRHDAGGRGTQASRWLDDYPAETSVVCQPAAAVQIQSAGLPGFIGSPDLLTALASQHQKINLTSLEDMVQCRFKFFAGRTLGLRSRPERPDERLQPKVWGLIMHEALEAWLNVDRQGDFVVLLEQAFDRACREQHLPAGYRLEVERINLNNIARKVSATEQWEPLSSQAEVDLTLDYPGGITVTCRVDRIDRMSDTDCIILDYKAGKTARVEQMVESQVKLQGPLYALAVRERMQLNTIAMMYLAIREDTRFGWGEVPGAKLDLKPIPPNWIEDARDRSIVRLESFLGGDVHAEPTEADSCRWCDFRHACRIGERQAQTMAGGVAND